MQLPQRRLRSMQPAAGIGGCAAHSKTAAHMQSGRRACLLEIVVN